MSLNQNRMILPNSGAIGSHVRSGPKRKRMKLWMPIHNGLKFKRLFALTVAGYTAAFSSQAQFSITLSSVQDLGGAVFDNGHPINYIYDFTISGDFSSNPDYSLYGISLCLSGFGDHGAIDGGFGASHVGGWLPTNPPEFQDNSVSFEDYYSGGAVQGTITVVSTGSLQDSFDWSVGELGWVNPNGFPIITQRLSPIPAQLSFQNLPAQGSFLVRAFLPLHLRLVLGGCRKLRWGEVRSTGGAVLAFCTTSVFHRVRACLKMVGDAGGFRGCD